MAKPVLIFGTSPLSKLAHYYLREDMQREVAGFVVHKAYRDMATYLDQPVYCWEDLLHDFPPAAADLYMAIGYKRMIVRESLYAEAKLRGYTLVNIAAHSAFIANGTSLGDNNFFMPGCVIEPDVQLGNNNVFWSNTTICHDSKIGSHSFFASNVTIGGGARIGNRTFLGFSAVVLQGRHIGDDVLVGAQSLVTHDAGPLVQIHGAPAKTIKYLTSADGVCVD